MAFNGSDAKSLYSLIDGVDLFAELDANAKQEVADVVQLVELEAGVDMAAVGHFRRGICFVFNGCVEIAQNSYDDGSERLLRCHSGDLIGVFEAGELQRRNLSLLAKQRSLIGIINMTDLHWLLEKNSSLAMRLVFQTQQLYTDLSQNMLNYALKRRAPNATGATVHALPGRTSWG